MMVHRKLTWTAAALLLLGPWLPAAVVRAEEDPAALMKRVREAVPKVPFVAKGKLSGDRGLIRELELSHKTVNGVESSYMEVTAPMDLKDTRFLVIDRETGRDEQYIYVPAARRAIQVGGQTRKQAFLGSEFYVGDLVQPDVDAFTYKLAGAEEIGGRKCTLIEATPKNPGEELYSKSIFAVDPADLVVVRTQLFDDKGKLLKVWTVDKLEKIDGVWTPVSQEMRDVQESHWSRIEMSDIKYNVELPDDVFNKSHLTR
jgi:hypothetical protein